MYWCLSTHGPQQTNRPERGTSSGTPAKVAVRHDEACAFFTDDPGDEQVDPERVWQTWGVLLSGIQKEFTQLTGFESPEEALNKLKGRYKGDTRGMEGHDHQGLKSLGIVLW